VALQNSDRNDNDKADHNETAKDQRKPRRSCTEDTVILVISF
jgi:hypothetical protein